MQHHLKSVYYYRLVCDHCSWALTLPASHYKLLEKLLIIARKCILQRWIKDTPPNVTLWYRENLNTLPHERLLATSRGNDGLFIRVWSPFLDYLPTDLKALLLRGGGVLIGKLSNINSGWRLRLCWLINLNSHMQTENNIPHSFVSFDLYSSMM